MPVCVRDLFSSRSAHTGRRNAELETTPNSEFPIPVVLVFSQILMKREKMMVFFLTEFFDCDRMMLQKEDARKSTSRNSAGE